MDAFNFIHFLKNPAYLHQVTFQEINNLIEQYPFCQNLHYLALRKAQYENHKDFVKKLELAATYSPNRQWLYRQLQDVQVAVSDETVLTEEEPILTAETTEMGLAPNTPEIAEDEVTEAIVPAPVYYREAEPDNEELPEEAIDPTIEEDIETLTEETPGDTPPSDEYMGDDSAEESSSEHFETTDTDNTNSHSISDSDDVPTEIDTTDELDVNLENPEDMKLPDYKDSKVIFMEDLVDEVPPIEESLNIVEPTEEFNNNPTSGFFEPFVEVQEDEEKSSAVSDLEEEEYATPDIPFEIHDAREQPEEEDTITFFDEVPSEAEGPEADPISDEDQEMEEETEDELEEERHLSDEDPDFILDGDTAHLVDSDIHQLDQPAYPSDSVENKPFAAMINDDDQLQHSNEEDEEDEELEEDLTAKLSNEGSQKKPKPVGPTPKSAFSSWRKNKKITSSPLKEKKSKKKKSKAAKVVAVADLFKEKKKEKKKKNNKKKNTKRDAMQSLLEHEDVISETLAEIVAEQGQKKKAIKMYRRLIAMHPTKETIYMDRIEELKKMD